MTQDPTTVTEALPGADCDASGCFSRATRRARYLRHRVVDVVRVCDAHLADLAETGALIDHTGPLLSREWTPARAPGPVVRPSLRLLPPASPAALADPSAPPVQESSMPTFTLKDPLPPETECRIADCTTAAKHRGLCKYHYGALYRANRLAEFAGPRRTLEEVSDGLTEAPAAPAVGATSAPIDADTTPTPVDTDTDTDTDTSPPPVEADLDPDTRFSVTSEGRRLADAGAPVVEEVLVTDVLRGGCASIGVDPASGPSYSAESVYILTSREALLASLEAAGRLRAEAVRLRLIAPTVRSVVLRDERNVHIYTADALGPWLATLNAVADALDTQALRTLGAS